MHLMLKMVATNSAGKKFFVKHAGVDDCIKYFNTQRLQQALDLRMLAEPIQKIPQA
jgi:hypothetical protein